MERRKPGRRRALALEIIKDACAESESKPQSMLI